MITQEYLKIILNYNPETGIFLWNSNKSPRIRKGGVAGCLSCQGYWQIKIDSNPYFAHRLAFIYMTGGLPENKVDHINGNKLDNSWLNLRDVTYLENQKNRKIDIRNKSGLMGVRFMQKENMWQSSITKNYKSYYLGRFVDFFEAACARKSAELTFGFHENHGKR